MKWIATQAEQSYGDVGSQDPLWGAAQEDGGGVECAQRKIGAKKIERIRH